MTDDCCLLKFLRRSVNRALMLKSGSRRSKPGHYIGIKFNSRNAFLYWSMAKLQVRNQIRAYAETKLCYEKSTRIAGFVCLCRNEGRHKPKSRNQRKRQTTRKPKNRHRRRTMNRRRQNGEGYLSRTCRKMTKRFDGLTF